jgi:hypothetical protein
MPDAFGSMYSAIPGSFCSSSANAAVRSRSNGTAADAAGAIEHSPNRDPPAGGKYAACAGWEPSSGNDGGASAPQSRWNSTPGTSETVNGFDLLVRREHRLAFGVVASDDGTHVHRVDRTSSPPSLRAGPDDRLVDLALVTVYWQNRP